MAFINDRVLDNGLSALSNEANRLDICSSEPTTFAAATDTESLGAKTGISVGSPTNRSPDGRRVTVAAIPDGDVTDDGEATHWAITDTSNNRLLAVGTLSAPQQVIDGNAFALEAFDIGISGVE